MNLQKKDPRFVNPEAVFYFTKLLTPIFNNVILFQCLDERIPLFQRKVSDDR